MRSCLKIGLCVLAALIVLVGIRIPVGHDVSGTQRIEVLSVVRGSAVSGSSNTYVRHSVSVTDPKEIEELCEMLPRYWRHPLDLNSLEDWRERYTLRFERAKGVPEISFTEREWSPSGETPEDILEWVRRRANQALQTTPMTRSVDEKTVEFGRRQRGV